jgi:hypothetical protein
MAPFTIIHKWKNEYDCSLHHCYSYRFYIWHVYVRKEPYRGTEGTDECRLLHLQRWVWSGSAHLYIHQNQKSFLSITARSTYRHQTFTS